MENFSNNLPKHQRANSSKLKEENDIKINFYPKPKTDFYCDRMLNFFDEGMSKISMDNSVFKFKERGTDQLKDKILNNVRL